MNRENAKKSSQRLSPERDWDRERRAERARFARRGARFSRLLSLAFADPANGEGEECADDRSAETNHKEEPSCRNSVTNFLNSKRACS